MSRKDVIIQKQQEQIERLTEEVKTYMDQNHALMNALIETEKRLRKYEDSGANRPLSDFAEMGDD